MRAEEVVAALGGKMRGGYGLARCPGHDDENPSLSVSERDGKILVKCHTGCSWEQISSGLQARGIDLRGRGDEGWQTPYVIRDAAGKALAQHVRVERVTGKSYFWCGPGGESKRLVDLGLRMDDLPLYGTELLAAAPGKGVVITEGEKAADALRRMGVLALGTTCGASATPGDAALRALAGRAVYLWPDNDEPGRGHMARISAALRRLEIDHHVVEWSGAPPKGDAADFADRGGNFEALQSLLTEARGRVSGVPGLRQLWEGVRAAEQSLDRFQVGDTSDRVQTGISSLDRALGGGMRPGTMVLLGAPSGSGKTSIVQQIAAHVSRKGAAVLLVSPEMDLEELAEREIIRRAGVPKEQRASWSKTQEQATAAHGRAAVELALERPRIYVLDRSETTMEDVAVAARCIVDLRLVIIDYAQQVADTSDGRKPRYLQVGDVAHHCIGLARELKVATLVASQVNTIQDKSEKRYTFRETAVLEQKAHTVLVFEVKWAEDETTDGAGRRTRRYVPEYARFVCTKHRSGPQFMLPVKFEPATFRVADE